MGLPPEAVPQPLLDEIINAGLYAPSGMDDSELKSCDVYNVALFLTREAVAETEPETVETVAEAAAETVVEAPKTFDAGVIAAIAAIVSAAGYACVKKH